MDIGYPWDARGVPVGCPRDAHEMPAGLLRDAQAGCLIIPHGMPTLVHGTHEIPMGRP